MEILVILLALIPLALLVGGLAWFAYTSWTGRHVAFQETLILPVAPEDAAGLVQARLTPAMREYGYGLVSQSPSGLLYSYTFRPLWLIFPCVLLFPIGLLSLLYKKTVDSPSASHGPRPERHSPPSEWDRVICATRSCSSLASFGHHRRRQSPDAAPYRVRGGRVHPAARVPRPSRDRLQLSRDQNTRTEGVATPKAQRLRGPWRGRYRPRSARAGSRESL